jgi:cell division protein FtsQ
MAAVPNKRDTPVSEASEEEVQQTEVEIEGTDTGAAQEQEAEQAPRKSKARAPRRSTTPLRDRLRRKPASAPGDRRPMQRSLFPMFSPEVSQRAAKVGGGVILFIGLLGGLVVGFQFFAGSRFFALRGLDVEGNKLLSTTEIETIVRSRVPRGVLRADLTKIREDLESHSLVREAQVIRLLPDRLRIRILERTPIAVVRLANESAACVDENGTIFGDLSTWRGQTMPPIIRGLAESGDHKEETNRRWIDIYKRLIADLDQDEPPLSLKIDEVIFDSEQGVRLLLANSRIVVLIGNSDFRIRLNTALDVIDAVQDKNVDALNLLRISDATRLLGGIPIKYLNVTDPHRVVVGLDE